MKTSCETVGLPVAVRKKMGVVLVRYYAQVGLTGEAPAVQLLFF